MQGLVFYINYVRCVICKSWYFILTMFALLYIRVGIIASFILTMFSLLYARVGILY